MSAGYEIKREQRTENVTFAASTASSAVANSGFAGGTFTTPASIASTTVGFKRSNASGGTYTSIYETSGAGLATSTLIAIAVAASRTYRLPDELFGCPFWKFEASNAETGTWQIDRST